MQIPIDLWSQLLSLFFDYATKNQTVSVEFIAKDDLLRILVPEQEAGSCWTQATFQRTCDLNSGEDLIGFPPDHWRHVGGAYCHNTMSPFFSRTTDTNELNIPGIHLCFGKLNFKDGSYQVAASKVKQHRRFEIPIQDITSQLIKPSKIESKIEFSTATFSEGLAIIRQPYHPKIHNYIHKPKFKKGGDYGNS